MHSPCPKLLALFFVVFVSQIAARRPLLRVCADPNNLPFSNQSQQGFENKLATLIAHGMNAELKYAWVPQRKSFARRSLQSGLCDVVMGVPASMPDVLTTKPYYRSSYMFISRSARRLQVTSLADPRLADLRIGIHIVGDDYAPPAYALAHRGITQNIQGFSLFGEYGEPNPPRKLIDAVDRGQVDVAIAWGPLAGYFAHKANAPLAMAPVTPSIFLGVPFAFDISAAVRPGNINLKTEVDHILESQSTAVQLILGEYHVPQVP